uniref:Putative ring finger n=1 Tax=Ixodes ricinus TaxID=34613 RepID=A0A0K8RL38_IXORI
MPSFEVTVRDFPDLKDRTRILLQCKPPEGASCLRCGDLAGISWQAACGHSFCNDCKDVLTKSHVLTCPVHFSQTPKASLKRTDRGIQETKDSTAGCAWEGCCTSGTLQFILKHCEHCPKKPRLRRNYSWQCSQEEVEDNLHNGLVKIVKPLSPTSTKFDVTHPLEFTVGFHGSSP